MDTILRYESNTHTNKTIHWIPTGIMAVDLKAIDYVQ
jgi:hypothetical protein